MKSLCEIGFEIETTGDGSPSLRMLQPVAPERDKGESMHHSGGACAETNLIYGVPIRETLAKISQPRFMIVGLGLGYIELVIAREALLAGKEPQEIALITSFESVPELREYFHLWLRGDHSSLSAEIVNTYNAVLEFIVKDHAVSSQAVKDFLLFHFPTSDRIQGALSEQQGFDSLYHCFLYDAFSSKTSPHLWEESFLNNLLAKAAAESSQLSTYACKASLKRVLKNQGFDVVVREGFQGKRNSTLGVRGVFTSRTS